MGLLRAPLLLLTLLALAQPFSLDVPSSDEAHHHHDHGHHGHDEHHGHHDHDEHHNHEEEREGKASALEGLDTVIGDIFPDTLDTLDVAGSLAEAVARGGVDFSEATITTGEDGVAKSCVEKEETRQEYRWVF